MPCILALRNSVFNNIINNNNINNNNSYESNNNRTIQLSFENRTSSVGYTVKLYQSFYPSSQTKVLGKVSFVESSFNETLLSQIRPSLLETICAKDCPVGYKQIVSGSLACCWSCEKCSANTISTVINTRDCLQCSAKKDNNDNHTQCIPVQRVSLTFSSTYTLLGTVLVLLSLTITITIIIYIYSKRHRPLMKASDPLFCALLLSSLIIGHLAAFFCLLQPSRITCALEYITTVVFVSSVTSSLSFRCLKIFIIFASSERFSRPKYRFVFNARGQIMYNMIILTINLSLSVVSLYYKGWQYAELQVKPHRECYLSCFTENYIVAAMPLMLSCVLFVMTLCVAFRMKRFPHNFRETLNIFLATGVVFISCLMFLTGYSLSPAKIKALMRSLVIYTTTLTFQVSMFAPKLIRLSKSVDVEVERYKIKKTITSYISGQLTGAVVERPVNDAQEAGSITTVNISHTKETCWSVSDSAGDVTVNPEISENNTI